MNEKIIELVVREFSKTSSRSFEKTFKLEEEGEYYTVTINRKRPISVNESLGLESRANTISALPSGISCGCCGGSGRSD